MADQQAPADRVTYNEPGEWLGADYALGLVDEIVVYEATTHLEMTSDAAAYLHVESPRRDVFARIYARPTTRAERRQILAKHDDRLRDHLRSVVPFLHRRKMRTIWSVPVWRRASSAVRDWRDARRQASAVLCVRIDEDRHCGGPVRNSRGYVDLDATYATGTPASDRLVAECERLREGR